MLLLSILSISHKSDLLLLSKADPSLGEQCCGFRTRQHHLLSVRPGHIYLEAMQTIKRCFICLATQLGHIHLEVIQYENIFSEKMHYSSDFCQDNFAAYMQISCHLNDSLAHHLSIFFLLCCNSFIPEVDSIREGLKKPSCGKIPSNGGGGYPLFRWLFSV